MLDGIYSATNALMQSDNSTIILYSFMFNFPITVSTVHICLTVNDYSTLSRRSSADGQVIRLSAGVTKLTSGTGSAMGQLCRSELCHQGN